MRRHWSWQQTPLGAVKAIPRDGKPVSKNDGSDDAWREVETEIRRLIEDLTGCGKTAVFPQSPTRRDFPAISCDYRFGQFS
jgi:hypothetical protein